MVQRLGSEVAAALDAFLALEQGIQLRLEHLPGGTRREAVSAS
jgi:hypothetical protein